jgi:hypothetical protein
MPKRSSQRWTADDETALRDLVEKGFYLRRISLRLRRSESSIQMRARDLNIKVKPTPRYRLWLDPSVTGYKEARG